IAEQDRLLGICFLLVPHLLGFSVSQCFCDRKVSASFPETPEVRIHVQKNLFTCVFDGKSCLLLCEGSFSNLVALLPPVQRLPSKQGANGAYVLWQKIDICRSDEACLDGDVRDVMRLLALGRQLSLAHAI